MVWKKVNEVDARWALGQYKKLQRSLMRYDAALDKCKKRCTRLRGSLGAANQKIDALQRQLGPLEYRLIHRRPDRVNRGRGRPMVRTHYAWVPLLVEMAVIQRAVERAWIQGHKSRLRGETVSRRLLQAEVVAALKGAYRDAQR